MPQRFSVFIQMAYHHQNDANAFQYVYRGVSYPPLYVFSFKFSVFSIIVFSYLIENILRKNGIFKVANRVKAHHITFKPIITTPRKGMEGMMSFSGKAYVSTTGKHTNIRLYLPKNAKTFLDQYVFSLIIFETT